MSTLRRQSPKMMRDADGNILCSCGCGQRPQPPRRTWFSQECVDKWREANDLSYLRRCVEDRDHGVCSMCGIDTDRLRERLPEPYRAHEVNRYDARFYSTGSWTKGGFRKERYERACLISKRWSKRWREAANKRRDTLHAAGWPLWRQTWWDADHIVPVCEGGGQCGIENYRTLCYLCHKRVTSELATRRARARRITVQPELIEA